MKKAVCGSGIMIPINYFGSFHPLNHRCDRLIGILINQYVRSAVMMAALRFAISIRKLLKVGWLTIHLSGTYASIPKENYWLLPVKMKQLKPGCGQANNKLIVTP
jgi:hypothetical protein